MSDLVFLLLIFFMITSTLVAPNVIKLLLPGSANKSITQESVTVYINEDQNFVIEDSRVNEDILESRIAKKLEGQTEGTVILKAGSSVPVEDIVTVIDAVNDINQKNGTRHKVILATLPK
jgi:biopolymer transport protein ExbD